MRVFGQWQIQEEMLGDHPGLHETCNELNLNMNCLKSGVAGAHPGRHERAPRTRVPTSPRSSRSPIQVILSGVHIWHQRLLGIDPNARVGCRARRDRPRPPRGP